MSVKDDGFLDAIAGLSGKTAFEVWESGNDWSEIVKNAESVLGKQSKWNVLADEAGNAFQIVGKNGKYINVESVAGTAEEYIAGNQLVTDVVKESSGALTAYTGNIVDAGGTVTKKGLALGASTGAKAIMGGLAAFGAISTGVNWYKENPQFWTDVSAKLLPFGFADPTDKSWGEIFQEALIPTAVDSDGNTYVQADLIDSMYRAFYDAGVFDVKETASYTYTKKPFKDFIEKLNGVEIPLYESVSFYNKSRPSAPYFSSTVPKSSYDRFIALCSNGNPHLNYVDWHDYLFVWISKGNVTDIVVTGKYGSGEQPFSNMTDRVYANGAQYSSEIDISYEPYPSHSLTISEIGGSVFASFLDNISRELYDGSGDEKDAYYRTLAYIAIYGNISSTSLLPNTTFPNGVPTAPTLQEAYPDWYKNAVTSVNPNWKPGESESGDNPKYVTWLPLQFPDKDVPDGATEPDITPEEAQSGKPKPDTPVNPDTNTAYNDGVLPNPYPNADEEPSVNPSPQPQPQPQPTPEPTDPSDPGSIPTPDPTPGLPAIGGGSANALWKIYNPSQAVLQAFGKWLWSTDPVKMIKELFSNNPVEGIVGLHMIYVTPPTGGTANIVVGYVDSGVASPWVSQQYVPLDCGSVTIPLRYQSALDFGYTKVYCYLPFIGIVSLDSFDVIGKTVHIRYTVDVLTGTVLAQISVSDGNYSAVLYTFNGSCSVEYPLTSGSRASQVLSLVTGAVGGAVVGGVGGAILGGARGALTGADVRMSGNISGNAGAMGIRKPYIIVKRPVEVAARNYNDFYGYPANTTGRLSTFSGYTRVKDVHVENISGATAEEKQEIENLLKSGVIVQ